MTIPDSARRAAYRTLSAALCDWCGPTHDRVRPVRSGGRPTGWSCCDPCWRAGAWANVPRPRTGHWPDPNRPPLPLPPPPPPDPSAPVPPSPPVDLMVAALGLLAGVLLLAAPRPTSGPLGRRGKTAPPEAEISYSRVEHDPPPRRFTADTPDSELAGWRLRGKRWPPKGDLR